MFLNVLTFWGDLMGWQCDWPRSLRSHIFVALFNNGSNPLEDICPDWSYAELEPVVALLKHASSCGIFTPDPLIPFDVQPSKSVFEKVKADWILKYKQ